MPLTELTRWVSHPQRVSMECHPRSELPRCKAELTWRPFVSFLTLESASEAGQQLTTLSFRTTANCLSISGSGGTPTARLESAAAANNLPDSLVSEVQPAWNSLDWEMGMALLLRCVSLRMVILDRRKTPKFCKHRRFLLWLKHF